MLQTDFLAPGFLIASPRLDGSMFERSVIVMVHHDEEGAMGFIINKPLEVDFGSLLEMVELDPDTIGPECYAQEVYFGGPVRVEQLWVMYRDLHGAISENVEALQEAQDFRFHARWALSGASDSIRAIALERSAKSFWPFVGYAGWGPGQLEGEIGEGSWLMLDFEEDFVFDTAPPDMWQAALDKLGIDETMFTMMGKGGDA